MSFHKDVPLVQANGDTYYPRTTEESVWGADGERLDNKLAAIDTALAGKVDNSRVLTDVPAGAKFTDTIYIHPDNANTRHVTDTEKSTWNGKSEKSIARTATLTVAGWSGTDAPYTQSVSVTGATASNNILFDIGMGVTAEQFEAGMDAQLKATGQGVNTVTIKAFGDKPTVDIPVQFVILG